MPTEGIETQNGDSNNKHEFGPMPKHIPFPDFVGMNSEFMNELIIFVFFASSSFFQFVNIYRTHWWLPDSYTAHKVNFDLIEPYLVYIIAVVIIRRLAYYLLLNSLEILQKKKGRKEQIIFRACLKYAFITLFAAAFGYCAWKIYVRHSYFALFLLVYPLILYFLIFGLKIEPFLRTQCEVNGAYLNGLPMHSCSSNPTAIREEIEALRFDFNLRFRQIIYTSTINTYFTTILPCFFAVSMRYNTIWATQHMIYVFFSGLTFTCAFIFPSKYGDLMHRASLHLGKWYQLENSSVISANVAEPFDKDQVYTHSSIVEYNDEYYKSIGPSTVAVPGNTSHTRFHALFQNPSRIFKYLTIFQCFIVLSPILLLCLALEWNFMLSIAFVTIPNHYPLFKIVRDYCLTRRIYIADISIGDRQNNMLHID